MRNGEALFAMVFQYRIGQIIGSTGYTFKCIPITGGFLWEDQTMIRSFDCSEEVKIMMTSRESKHDSVKLNGFVEKSNGNDHKERYNYLIC